MGEKSGPDAIDRQQPARVSIDVRREYLSWVGVIGAIVTLLTGIQDFVKLANWAAFVVDYFSEATLWFWSKLFFFLPQVTPLAGWLLNLVFFFIAMALTAIRKRADGEPTHPKKNALRDALMGFGLVIFLGFAALALVSLYKSGQLAPADYVVLQTVSDGLGHYVSRDIIPMVLVLMVVLPLILIMNGIGWVSRLFGGIDDQRLAVVRVWRVNFGIMLVLALSAASELLAPLCAAGGVLARLCG